MAPCRRVLLKGHLAMADRDGEDDKLLRSLGALQAEEQREGARSKWERLVNDALSAEELAALEHSAEEDPETKRLLEASRPLDKRARERIANALAARTFEESSWRRSELE